MKRPMRALPNPMIAVMAAPPSAPSQTSEKDSLRRHRNTAPRTADPTQQPRG